MKYKLSICLPARSEEFLRETVEDILKNKEDATEIIVGLDGEWSNPPIAQHPDVTVVYVPESVGQRAITNLCVKLSRAKYVAKADSHCSFDKGFDKKMIEAFEKVGDDVTMVPIMKNLHIYDWKCHKCGARIYQDKAPTCPDCGNEMKKKMLWRPRRGTRSVSYCFNSEPHFEYFNEYKNTEKHKKELETGFTETMSLQGSFFMCSRKKYLDLNLCDEKMGSWGNQGIEVACKTWLSGGRVLVNHNTWYAHCFRTKSVFGFPYPQSGNEVSRTKKRVKDLFWNGKHPKQIHPVSWLVRRFNPSVWSKEDIQKLEEHEKNLKK